jgi:hypothetical protein
MIGVRMLRDLRALRSQILNIDVMLDEPQNIAIWNHAVGVAVFANRLSLGLIVDPSHTEIAGITGVIPTPKENGVSAGRSAVDNHILLGLHITPNSVSDESSDNDDRSPSLGPIFIYKVVIAVRPQDAVGFDFGNAPITKVLVIFITARRKIHRNRDTRAMFGFQLFEFLYQSVHRHNAPNSVLYLSFQKSAGHLMSARQDLH